MTVNFKMANIVYGARLCNMRCLKPQVTLPDIFMRYRCLPAEWFSLSPDRTNPGKEERICS